MSSEPLVIRAGRISDVDALVEIYQAAQRWLAQQGSDQWAKKTLRPEFGASSRMRSTAGGVLWQRNPAEW